MNYKDAVERKLPGETDELGRRRELLDKIVIAYERGGESAIKSALIALSDGIIREFEKLLIELRKKL